VTVARAPSPTPWRRRLGVGLAALVTLGAAAFGGVSCAMSAPRYVGPVSDHFDGETFHNDPDIPDKGLLDILAWQTQRKRGKWPAWVPNRVYPKPRARVGPGELEVWFVNHATTLVQLDGLNVLTDPIYSDRASPVSWAGPGRARAPGIAFDDLPPIDAVVISHNHYDHLDVATLRRLAERHHPQIYVGLGNELLLAREGVDGAVPLDWHEARELRGVTVRAVPSQHWSARWIGDQRVVLWAAWLLESPSGGRVYFAGDTGYGPHFAKTRARYGDVRLALLPIGAYEPRWFMKHHHMSPDDALVAHADLGARTSVAIHFGTFALADDGYDEAPTRAAELAKAAGARFLVLDQGEGVVVPP
jgi:L-ascorbate metabolism protein UlaG (beta-lactamase superfamily)